MSIFFISIVLHLPNDVIATTTVMTIVTIITMAKTFGSQSRPVYVFQILQWILQPVQSMSS